jgi:hypothetical protein
MQHYTEIATIERDGFQIIVDRTWEDCHPRDLFDDSVSDIKEICEKIDRGIWEWFVLRVRVMLDGREFGSSYLGGCLYEDPTEVLRDGVVEDLIAEALRESREELVKLKQRLETLAL